MSGNWRNTYFDPPGLSRYKIRYTRYRIVSKLTLLFQSVINQGASKSE